MIQFSAEDHNREAYSETRVVVGIRPQTSPTLAVLTATDLDTGREILVRLTPGELREMADVATLLAATIEAR